jgi:hypothetical protein
MNMAAIVEAIFSIVPTARNIPSSKIHLPQSAYPAGSAVPHPAFI